jgi:hypothetical protein
MYAFSVGFVIFGGAVCVSALVLERRPRLSGNRIVRSRLYPGTRLQRSPLGLVTTLASVTLDVGSWSESEVDIHGVEAESDLEKSHVTSPRGKKVADPGRAADK